MKYAVVYAGCMIVEADSEAEAEEAFYEDAFYEENMLTATEKIALVQPCYSNMYEVADDLAESAASAIIG